MPNPPSGSDPSGYSTSSPQKHNVFGAYGWRRFYAKSIDGFLIAGFIFPLTGITLAKNLSLPAAHGSLWAAKLALGLGFEASCIANFGTTPGKKVFSIALANASGDLLSFSAALQRSLRALLYGMALGIPWLRFFVQYRAYKAIKQQGYVSWDKGVLISYGPLPKVADKFLSFTTSRFNVPFALTLLAAMILMSGSLSYMFMFHAM